MFSVNVDMSEIASLMGLGDELKKASAEAARDLGMMIEGKAKELAGERLHSRREMFVNGLSTREEDGVLIVSLSGTCRWIDDGMPEHSLLPALLASPKAKRAKDGSTYLVVPFENSPGKGKTTTSATDQDIMSVLKGEFKRRGLPWGALEKNSGGEPKQGKLHSFNILTSPLKTAEGPGMGKGPIGAVRQGGSGTPFLANVNVYQNKMKNGSTKKSVMTFRIASSKHAGQQKWDYPGVAGANILSDAADWGVETFNKEIAGGIIAKVLTDLDK